MSFKCVCSPERILSVIVTRIPYADVTEYDLNSSMCVYISAANLLEKTPIAAVMSVMALCLGSDRATNIVAAKFTSVVSTVLKCASSLGYDKDDEDAVAAMLEGAFKSDKVISKALVALNS